MKTILPLVLSLAACGVVAQNNNKVFPPAEPASPATPNDFATPAPSAFSAVPARAAKPGERSKSKLATAPGVMAQPVLPPPAPERGGGGGFGGGGGASVTVKKDRTVPDNDLYLPRSTKTGRTLVVQTSNPDATAIANAEEDLSVMALILRKTTGGSHGDDKRMAMGIEVDSAVFGSSSGARNMYVEGYGALFLLGVRFPLVAPPDKAEETTAKNEPASDWAAAREEYLRTERNTIEVQLERVWTGVNQLRGERIASEEYDAEKVEDLKTELLEALKNATHIRALKPDEFVTVVIQGAETMRVERTVGRVRTSVSDASVKLGGGRRDSGRGETVMTIRVKKSDVDALAKGILDLAGFREKAAIQTYYRRGDASVATSPFLSPPTK